MQVVNPYPCTNNNFTTWKLDQSKLLLVFGVSGRSGFGPKDQEPCFSKDLSAVLHLSIEYMAEVFRLVVLENYLYENQKLFVIFTYLGSSGNHASEARKKRKLLSENRLPGQICWLRLSPGKRGSSCREVWLWITKDIDLIRFLGPFQRMTEPAEAKLLTNKYFSLFTTRTKLLANWQIDQKIRWKKFGEFPCWASGFLK